MQLAAGGDSGGGGESSKMRTGRRGVTPHVYVRTYTFHVFGTIFVLQCLVLFVKI